VDLSYGAENEAFRDTVRLFLSDNWQPAALRGAQLSTYVRGFLRRAVDAGLLYRGIPKQYGGSEQPPDIIKAQIIREEFAALRAPMEVVGNGTSMLVPTLLDRGTQWQKEKFVRPTIEGDMIWAQGYSEPGTGSDLASVRTRGELVGDEWIINGQKTWTSGGQYSHYMFALIRTEPNAPKHQGISYLLIDLKQPGVTVRPLKQMTGEAGFSEFFFDNVRTPADWIIGERGQGWQVSRTTLKHERASIGNADRGLDLVEKLLELARKTTRFGKPAIEDPQIRQDIAALEGWALAHKYSSYRLFSLALEERDSGLLGLLSKLLTTDIGHESARISQELIGSLALLQPAPAGPGVKRGEEKWIDQIMGSLGVSIAGGASNIQRNIISERGLGLPRDLAMKSDA
jgi:alkylation response protein AidB-like acyl-CoA dehydrogenase